MIHELDRVVLTADLDGTKFKAGDVGTVVHLYESGELYEVEFFTANGITLDVLTVPASQVRLPRSTEVMHVRALE